LANPYDRTTPAHGPGVGDDETMTNRIRNRLRPTGDISPAVLERLAADPRAEAPGPDGIRHRLVARIKAEIEAGTYLTEERWLAAESRLLRAVAGD
jgi:anti-sigma28 factor (negative regulator of flagellin synthesis)